MISQLLTGKKVVGLKQTRRAVSQNRASCAFYAQDADPELIESLVQLCADAKIPCEGVASMRELGLSCGITVGAAAAALMLE